MHVADVEERGRHLDMQLPQSAKCPTTAQAKVTATQLKQCLYSQGREISPLRVQGLMHCTACSRLGCGFTCNRTKMLVRYITMVPHTAMAGLLAISPSSMFCLAHARLASADFCTSRRIWLPPQSKSTTHQRECPHHQDRNALIQLENSLTPKTACDSSDVRSLP
jgi:hypothetical protein